jgi:hypothetical protein
VTDDLNFASIKGTTPTSWMVILPVMVTESTSYDLGTLIFLWILFFVPFRIIQSLISRPVINHLSKRGILIPWFQIWETQNQRNG